MKNKKSTKKSQEKNIEKKNGTITSLVLRLFKIDPEIRSVEMITKVKKTFPKSAFKLSHYSWYKYQIKKGRYNLPSRIISQL